MKLYVHKYPNPTAIAECEHVADDAPPPAAPRELMTLEEFEQWKAQQSPLPLPPEPPWRVSKDTLISRVLAAGKLPEVMSALASQTPEQQFVFEHSAWFWSTNATLRGLCTALGMDADEIMARDEFLM